MKKVGIITVRSDITPQFEGGEYQIDYSVSPLWDTNQCSTTFAHSYAAATKGKVILHTFDSTIKESVDRIKNCDIILILIDGNAETGNSSDAIGISLMLKELNKVVLIGFQESIKSLQNILFYRPEFLSEFIEILALSECDAMHYSVTTSMKPFWEQIGIMSNKPIEYVPNCFNKEMSLELRVDPLKRNGIFIGTGTFSVPLSRYSLLGIAAAAKLNTECTLVWQDHSNCQVESIKSLFKNKNKINVIHSKASGTKPLNWIDWLNLISKHKICICPDYTFTAGRVPGDCLIANIPCIGGNGDIQLQAFPNLASDSTSLEEIISISSKLLNNEEFYLETLSQMDLKLNGFLSYENNVSIWNSIHNKYNTQ